MNKAELVEEVSGEVGLSKRETQKVIDAIIGTIGDTLAAGEKVTLVGFGTFRVVSRKARRGINPQTRVSIQIPAKKVPKFMAGRALKEKVR
ncbi:DNA-binding protein HU [subsurface metagenome]